MLSARQKLGASRKDIFRHLLAEDSETGSKFTQEQLNANANLIIVAGADTTSSSLTQTFRTLATNERVLRKLQREIDGVGVELTVESTKGLVYLNAVVNEALRLLNPLPSGVQATTSRSGVEVDGTFLPGNIQVRVPHLVIMTDERYFPKPNEFIPERWTGERPELLLDRRAFIPFGYGVHSCVGKQLALNEMRLVLARVVSEFDVLYGESYDDAKFEEDWKDYAVLKIGDCFLKFVQREVDVSEVFVPLQYLDLLMVISVPVAQSRSWISLLRFDRANLKPIPTVSLIRQVGQRLTRRGEGRFQMKRKDERHSSRINSEKGQNSRTYSRHSSNIHEQH